MYVILDFFFLRGGGEGAINIKNAENMTDGVGDDGRINKEINVGKTDHLSLTQTLISCVGSTNGPHLRSNTTSFRLFKKHEEYILNGKLFTSDYFFIFIISYF